MTKTKTTESSESTADPVGTEQTSTECPRDEQAMELVKGYVPWSAGAGLLPIPMVDMAALLTVQLRMLSKLSQMYQVPFKDNVVKGIVSTMLGTVVSSGVGGSLGAMAKAIPLVGPAFGVVVMPGVYSAATYAVGRVFVSHFESGGTFLDFDPKKMREYFVSEFEKAKDSTDSAQAH